MPKMPVFIVVVALVCLITPALAGAPGYKIAYESEEGEEGAEQYNIYVTDLMGSAPVLAYENARHPSLTAEGTVFFTRYEETEWGDYWKSYYISHRGIEEITTNTVFTELDPTVARDGRSVVYSSARAGTAEIIFEPLSPAEPTLRITKNDKDDIEPTIDGKGEYIYYTLIAGEESYIYKVKSDGTGSERLSSTGMHDRHPSVSGDNRLLAFATERDRNSEIYVMDLKTRAVTRLTNNAAWDGNPCISSDGKWIVFSSDRDGNKEIYAIGPDGKGITRLTNNDIPDDYPAIT